jgi:hypothetical protein
MSKRPCTFKATDVTRAVRAVIAAGMPVKRVEVDKTGTIIVHVGDHADGGTQGQRTEWDTI